MAKKGDWVRIHKVVLPAAERTAKIPDDTKQVDFEMWVKGTLQNETAEIGEEVTIVTATGREETGKLLEVNPYYTHSYGKFVPEIVEIDKQIVVLLNQVLMLGLVWLIFLCFININPR